MAPNGTYFLHHFMHAYSFTIHVYRPTPPRQHREVASIFTKPVRVRAKQPRSVPPRAAMLAATHSRTPDTEHAKDTTPPAEEDNYQYIDEQDNADSEATRSGTGFSDRSLSRGGEEEDEVHVDEHLSLQQPSEDDSDLDEDMVSLMSGDREAESAGKARANRKPVMNQKIWEEHMMQVTTRRHSF